MTYTQNPELDAARHDDEIEAADALHETANREAPGIVIKQLAAINTPGDWFDTNLFAAGNSAESILQGAFDDANDDVADRYAEFMLYATPDARNKLLQAMATWFSSVYAFEIYLDWMECLK